MKYLLDTCVISDFIKGDKNTLNKIKNSFPDDLAISCITYMEIHYGLHLNPKRSQQIKKILNNLFESINIIPFFKEDAEQAAKIRSVLKQQSNLIGSYDILLAGTAISNQLILVSSNLKEFLRVKDLKIENWRS